MAEPRSGTQLAQQAESQEEIQTVRSKAYRELQGVMSPTRMKGAVFMKLMQEGEAV